MTVGNVTLNNQVANSTGKVNSVLNNESDIQNQLNSKERRLNNLDADQEMTAEEKAKERREIQEQIAELKRKLQLEALKQAEAEEKAQKEKAQEKVQKEERAEQLESQIKTEEKSAEQIFVAETSLHQGKIRDVVTVKKEGMQNVLEAEIKSDKMYGSDTKEKQEKLSAMRREKDFEIKVRQVGVNSEIPGMTEGTKIIIKE